MKSEHDCRQYWIDWLKLLACVGVACHHLYLVFIGMSSYGSMMAPEWLQGACRLMNVFLNGNFWVCLFCMLSGWLMADRRAASLRELLAAILKRYVRLVLPFAAAGSFILLLGWLAGFPTDEGSRILGNEWLGGYYSEPLTLRSWLCFALFFDAVLDGPVWMMRALLAGNCLVYACTYISFRLSAGWKGNVCCLLVAAGALCLLGAGSSCVYVACCLLGAAAGLLAQKCPWQAGGFYGQAVLPACWLFLFTCHGVLADYGRGEGAYVITPLWNTAYGMALLLLLPGSPKLLTAWDRKCSYGGMSLPVYLLHWPVICAVSLPAYAGLAEWLGYTWSVMLASFLALCVSFGLALLYQRLWGRPLQQMQVAAGKWIDCLCGNAKGMRQKYLP